MGLRLASESLISSFFLSASVLLAYFLKANGTSSFLLLFALAVFGLLLKFLLRKDIDYSSILISSLFFFFLSLPLASRGPSLNNLLFVFSFSPFVLSLINRDEKSTPAVLYLGAVFATWSFVGNWEFPSVFSPFATYGVRELPFVSALLIQISNRLKDIRKRLFLLLVAVFSALPALPFLIRSEVNMLLNQHLSINLLLPVLSFAATAYAFWMISGQSKSENSEALFRTFLLVPPLLTTFALLSHAKGSSLPLPFDLKTIVSAAGLSFCLFISSFARNAYEKNLNLFLLVSILFFLRLFAPAELNIYRYHQVEYSNYSLGIEHFGPWFFLWMTVILSSLKGLSFSSIVALFASSLFATKLYFTRLYHFSSAAPIEFFKDLGSEGVSWIRKPVFAQEPYYALLILFIIFAVRFFLMQQEIENSR